MSAGGPEESGATTLSKQVSSVNAIKIQQVIDAVKQDFKNVPGFSDKLPPIRKSSKAGQVGQVETTAGEDIRKTDVSKSDVSDQSDGADAESRDKENGARIYSLELDEIVREENFQSRVRPDSGSPSGNERPTHEDYLPEGIHKLQLKHQKIKEFLEKSGEKSSGRSCTGASNIFAFFFAVRAGKSRNCAPRRCKRLRAGYI